jgi:hemerythrin-like domain-containing protein
MDNQPNVGNDLVRIHKVVTRALNITLENSQGEPLPEDRRAGFAAYVRALASLVDAHHLGEDELAFPFWKNRLPGGPFDELSRQHQEIIPYLERIGDWTAEPEAWQASAIQELHLALSDLQKLWETHIHLEEATVGPEKSAEILSPAENERLSRQMAEHGQAHALPAELVMPFVVYNLTPADREAFFKLIPPVVANQLVPFAWKPAWEAMSPFLLLD